MMLKCQVLSGNVRTTVKFLNCLEKVLLTRCGTLAATWQRETTMRMLLPTALDADCIYRASGSVCLHSIINALHEMQTRSSDENSVRSSVCLSNA